MPAPPKKLKKKKKRSGASEPGIKMSDEEKHIFLSCTIETLERELQNKSGQAEEALRSEAELRSEVERREAEFKKEQATTFAVTADMVRQYKALQEEFIAKINSLETQLTEQKEEQDITNHELDELNQDKEDEIKQKDEQIQYLKDRINEMSQEFANMLHETLELMKKRVSDKFEEGVQGDTELTNCAQRLQEFSAKAFNAVGVSTRAIAGPLGSKDLAG